MFRIQVDKRNGVFPSAVFIDSVSVVGTIWKEFFDVELRAKDPESYFLGKEVS